MGPADDPAVFDGETLTHELRSLRPGPGVNPIRIGRCPTLLAVLGCEGREAAAVAELRSKCELLGDEAEILLVAFGYTKRGNGRGLEARRGNDVNQSTWVRRENLAIANLVAILKDEHLRSIQRADSLEVSLSGGPGEQVTPQAVERVLSTVTGSTVRDIAAQHIFVNTLPGQGEGAGRHGPSFYLDLHTASCRPETRRALGEALAEHLDAILGPRLGNGLVLASPREGNVLVGAAAAELLGVPFLMVRTKKAPRFGYPIEGRFEVGTEAVVIDDVVLEGSFILRCAGLLRFHGLRCFRCVSLFERTDADARAAFQKAELLLHSKYAFDEADLRRMVDLDEH